MMRAWLLLVFAWWLSTPAAFAADGATEEIVLWHAYRGAEERALHEVLRAWQGPPVRALGLPFDALATKLQAAIRVGGGPDLFIDAHERLGDYRERGIVAPVGEALVAEDYFPLALEGVMFDGVGFGLPLSQKCIALYFRRDLTSPPADGDTLESLMRRAPPMGGVVLAYEATSVYAHAPILASFGGELLTRDNRFGFVGERAASSLSFVERLLAAKTVPESIDHVGVRSLFVAGKALFALGGPSFSSDFPPEMEQRFGVAVLPAIGATGKPMQPLLTVESAMLTPRGAGRPEVRRLLAHLASADASRTRLSLVGLVPARRDVSLDNASEIARAFARQAQSAVVMPTSTAMRAMWEPAGRAMKKVLLSGADPQIALREAERRFEDIMRPLPARARPLWGILALGAVLLAIAGLATRRALEPTFRRNVTASLPAYRYVAHAAVVVGLLVIAPLVVGASTSLLSGQGAEERYVGLANYIAILSARGGPLLGSGSFYFVLGVTVLWTAANLACHVAIGVLLAIALSRPTLRFRGVYRALLILPWAVPSYVTALAWKGMFHKQFGAINGMAQGVAGLFGLELEPIAWFSSFSTAFAANVLTNVWLGFPFMMVVTIGALTGVSKDLLEAAEVDGASRIQRFWLVTLPVIRPALVPSIALGAIWTFNMFNVVFLVSGGEPDGTTEILISEAYRWAFTRQAQMGYAAAYAVIIFLLLAVPGELSRRMTRMTKERFS